MPSRGAFRRSHVPPFPRVDYLALVILCANCGGSAEAPQSPATVVRVASEQPPTESPAVLSDPVDEPVVSPLERLMQKHCGGMQRSERIVADLAGKAFAKPILLLPGQCYTVIAVAREGDSVELSLTSDALALPSMPPLVFAQGTTEGSAAVLGGNGNCFKQALPIAMPATLEVRTPSTSSEAEIVVCSR